MEKLKAEIAATLREGYIITGITMGLALVACCALLFIV